MIFARAVAVACLSVMRWLCLFTAALLFLVTVVQYVRGDLEARPLITLATGVAFIAMGWASGWGARFFLLADRR